MKSFIRFITSFFVGFIVIIGTIGVSYLFHDSMEWMIHHPMALCAIMPAIWILISWYLYSNLLEDFPEDD